MEARNRPISWSLICRDSADSKHSYLALVASLRGYRNRHSSSMSGLEIAGLVLGAIPVIIEALDSYRAGRSRATIWRKYGEVLGTLISELRLQEIFFAKNIERLLRSAGVDVSKLDAFTRSKAGSVDDEGANEDVQLYLGAAYTSFLTIVESYRSTFARIAMKLQESVEELSVGLLHSPVDAGCQVAALTMCS